MERLTRSTGQALAQEFDFDTHEQQRVDWYNATEGFHVGYDCPKCKNRGNFALRNALGFLAFRSCDCMEVRKSVDKMEQSGLARTVREKSFQKYRAEELWQQVLKKGAMAYAAKPQGWFLMCGQPGSGKTHLCTAVCRELLLRGEAVQYMSWRDAMAELKGAMAEGDRRNALMDQWKQARFLYIDDLFKVGKDPEGRSEPTRADRDLTFELVNYRYNNSLPTLFSTERSPDALLQIDEATGSRIIELAGVHLYSIDPDPKKNYRLRRAGGVQ